MIYEAETRSLRGRKGKADGVQFRKPGYVAAAAKPKSAQAVVKVISQARGYRAKVLMNYVARSDSERPLTMEDENGLEIQGVDGIESVYNDWRQNFERAASGQKRPPRHVTHMIFSGDCKQTPENARAVQHAIAELMQEQLGRDGYRYLMVLHTDTQRPHVHVVINNYNRDKNGPKLRINPPDLLVLRQQFAQKLRDRGIEQHATQRKDRLVLLENVIQGIEDLQSGGKWFERQLLNAAERNPLGPVSAEATPGMLKWAEDLASKNGVQLGGTDFETVRLYLDTHAPKYIGLNPLGSATALAADKPTAIDAFAKRRAMVKAVAKIKADVKATTVPFTQERRERMALLRQIDHQLIEPSAPDYKRLVENLMLKLGKDRERIQDQIRALADPTSAIQDRKRRRQREGAIDQIIGRNIEAVRSARLDLWRSPGVGVVEAYKLGAQLKSYERELQRIRRWHALGFAGKAAPGTAAEVAQERSTAAIVARATRTADKLEQLGAWHQPNPDAPTWRPFDPFAKRQMLTNIVTHLADRLDRSGVDAGHPLTKRVDALRQSLIEAPAPENAPLMAAIGKLMLNTRQRADFDVRRAAHPSTASPERVAILKRVRSDLDARIAGLTAARREFAELPNIDDLERRRLSAGLKRMALITRQAAQLVDKPAACVVKLAELDKLSRTLQPVPAKVVAVSQPEQQPARNLTHGADIYAGPAGYGLRNTPEIPWSEPQLYAGASGPGSPAPTLDSMRTLSSVDLDGRRIRGSMLLPDHARNRLENEGTALPEQLRRVDIGVGSGGSSTSESRREGGKERIELVAVPGDRLTQEQLGALLDRVHTRLVEAGRWDDETPFRSGSREFYRGDDGRQRAPVLDAFAKRRAMLQEIDQLKPEIDAAHVNFTPEMRRRLAGIREMRESIQTTPARDIEGAINRLAELVTNDQLRIERQKDTPAATATEALERRRNSERLAARNLQSIDAASREVQKAPGLQPMQRIALASRLKVMAKAMDIYSGKGKDR